MRGTSTERSKLSATPSIRTSRLNFGRSQYASSELSHGPLSDTNHLSRHVTALRIDRVQDHVELTDVVFTRCDGIWRSIVKRFGIAILEVERP